MKIRNLVTATLACGALAVLPSCATTEDTGASETVDAAAQSTTDTVDAAAETTGNVVSGAAGAVNSILGGIGALSGILSPKNNAEPAADDSADAADASE